MLPLATAQLLAPLLYLARASGDNGSRGIRRAAYCHSEAVCVILVRHKKLIETAAVDYWIEVGVWDGMPGVPQQASDELPCATFPFRQSGDELRQSLRPPEVDLHGRVRFRRRQRGSDRLRRWTRRRRRHRRASFRFDETRQFRRWSAFRLEAHCSVTTETEPIIAGVAVIAPSATSSAINSLTGPLTFSDGETVPVKVSWR